LGGRAVIACRLLGLAWPGLNKRVVGTFLTRRTAAEISVQHRQS